MKKLFFLVLVSFVFANTQAQITVSSNNNVGIGTSTPGEALEINGYIRGNSTYGGALRINTASNGYAAFGPENNTSCHMYTDRPNFIFNQTVCSMNGDFASYYTNDLIFKTGVSFYNYAGAVRMTIKNSTGYVGINNTSPSCALDVTGQIKMNGSVITSDARLKENIKDMSGSLASLVNLKGVTYKLKPPIATSIAANPKPTIAAKTDTSTVQPQPATQAIDTALYNRNHIGFLAQDVQKVYPELVYADKDGMLSVDYVSMIPLLVESIKEQQLVITGLKADIANLQAAVVELKKKVK